MGRRVPASFSLEISQAGAVKGLICIDYKAMETGSEMGVIRAVTVAVT